MEGRDMESESWDREVLEEHAGVGLHHKYAPINTLLLLFQCEQSIDVSVGTWESTGTRRWKVEWIHR
jgi:hypothetical protein